MLQSASVYAYGADTIETITIFKSVKNIVLSIQCYNNIWVYESINLTNSFITVRDSEPKRYVFHSFYLTLPWRMKVIFFNLIMSYYSLHFGEVQYSL